MHPWLDLTARLSRAPVVSIASIRGRARGAGSEFVLAADIRLAGDKAILAQFEVGSGVVPGGGPMARLPRLIGRGRALEVLLVADDISAALAERYGYVNRVVPDDELEAETDRIAPPRVVRQAGDRGDQGLRRRNRLAALAAQGLSRDSDLERRLGELVPLATQ
jgi:enoyl-CoA hydratase/carnithine racemase